MKYESQRCPLPTKDYLYQTLQPIGEADRTLLHTAIFFKGFKSGPILRIARCITHTNAHTKKCVSVCAPRWEIAKVSVVSPPRASRGK